MSNIEPTEEQKQAARELTGHHMVGKLTRQRIVNADDIAQLLAEREAKLREGLARIIEAVHVQMAATALPQPLIDVVRGVYAEHPYALHRIEDLEKVCHALQDERDTLRARVAELEAKAANLDARLWDRCEDLARVGLERVHADAVHSKREAQHLARIAELEAEVSESTRLRMTETLHGMGVEAMYQEREAQHLADIRALHQFLGDHEEEEGIWIPRSEFKDIPCRKYLDDAKADAGAVCTHSVRVWNVIDQTMRCRVCDDAKAAEGGEG